MNHFIAPRRRRLRRLGKVLGMVAGAMIAIFGLSMYFLTDTGAFETEAEELTGLRRKVDRDVFEWSAGQVAWLRISDTHIDYPVMRARDNEWYLSHDFLGREAPEGAVFLDYRNSFEDRVAIIYGHRMNGDLMFSDVAKYRDDEFFKTHLDGVLILRGGMRLKLQVIDFREIDASDKLYREFVLDDYDEPVIVLSTCDRAEHEKRDVLILQKKT